MHIGLKCFQLLSKISQLFRKRSFFHEGLQLRCTLTITIKRSYIAISIRDGKGCFLQRQYSKFVSHIYSVKFTQNIRLSKSISPVSCIQIYINIMCTYINFMIILYYILCSFQLYIYIYRYDIQMIFFKL